MKEKQTQQLLFLWIYRYPYCVVEMLGNGLKQ